MKRTKILLVILFVVAAFALVLTSFRRPSVADDSAGGIISSAKAKMAPDFTLQSFNLRAESAKQPIVMDFWATWCGPCREELPHLVTLSKNYTGKVAFYGINSSDMPADIAVFSHQEGISFPTLSDAGHKVAVQYGVDAIPLLVVIDTHGKVRAVTEGYDEQVEQNLSKVLDVLLKEK